MAGPPKRELATPEPAGLEAIGELALEKRKRGGILCDQGQEIWPVYGEAQSLSEFVRNLSREAHLRLIARPLIKAGERDEQLLIIISSRPLCVVC